AVAEVLGDEAREHPRRGAGGARAETGMTIDSQLLLRSRHSGNASQRNCSRRCLTVACRTVRPLPREELTCASFPHAGTAFLQATAPPGGQQAGGLQMKISSIVPEGTVVKQGDVVAELDRTTVAPKLQEVSLALQKAEAQYEQAMLDSTLNLSTARENIRTMELGLEEKRLAKEQAVYEAPTVKRQAEIDYEKAQRALAQAKADYETKTEQAKAKMREVGAEVSRQRGLLKAVQDFMAG